MIWQHVWRKGFAPLLSTKGLTALAEALERDDPRLIQGETAEPCESLEDFATGACAVGFCGWQGEGLKTAHDVLGYFNDILDQAIKRLSQPEAWDACWKFLDWFDETPRDEMRALLLAEVRSELVRRESVPA